MSELILTAVPGVQLGAEGALLRVVLVPRLTGPGKTLADYGIDSWPQIIAAARLQISLRTSAGVELAPIDAPVRTDVSAAVWSGFFSAITVRPFVGQTTYSTIEVAKTGVQSDQIIAAYQSTAERTGDPGTVATELAGLDLPVPPPPPNLAKAVPEWVPPDFHRALSLLREHPVVLRAVGFIVDVVIPKAELDRCGGSGEVSVAWAQVPATFDTITSPRTAFVVQDNRFLAAPAGVIAGGLVDLSTAEWDVVTVDVDAAVSRLGDAQQAVARTEAAARDGRVAGVDPTAMPALRSAGLQLIHRGRDEWFNSRNDKGRGNAVKGNLGDGPALTAEDLVLGYRLDMREPGREWHSLTRRLAHYTVGDVEIADLAEEGHVRPGAGVKGTDDVVRADEVVVRWEGRNLAVPRPALAAPGRAFDAARQPHPEREMPYDFQWAFQIDPAQPVVPGLRFGGEYDLRARVVDIAGGGLALGDIRGDAGATSSTLYGRFEPVLPPEMPAPAGLLAPAAGSGTGRANAFRVDGSVLGPGGAVDRLVVRSDPAGASAVVDGYPDNSSRTLLPPPATFDVTEQHGRLDGVDAETWRLARRALAPPRSTSEPRNGRSYTWLPDHAADGVSLTALPLAARIAPTRPTRDAWDRVLWPDQGTKSFVLSAGAPGSAVTADWTQANDAAVSLPPGVEVVLEIASTVHSDDLKLFAVGQWIAGNADATAAALAGRHPIITPAQKVHLVHAVRRPLLAPAANPTASRDAGSTFATVFDDAAPHFGIDRDTTASVDVSADWNEWIDAPNPLATDEVLESLRVGLDDPALSAITHEFGDTKHRQITYRLAARSRFREYFDDTDPDEAFVNEASLAALHVRSSARPVPPIVAAITPAFRWDRGTAGPGQSITHRREGGWLRVELAAPWYSTGEGERLGVIVSPGLGADALPGASAARGLIATAAGATSHLVTTAYRDPVFLTGLPVQPDHLSMTGGGPAHVVLDAESATHVVVVPFDVFYADGRRFADIGFGRLADQTYSPMVRLSIVRFQEHSLDGLEASTIVTSEIVNLLPTRTLQIDRTASGVIVSVQGLAPTSGPNAIEARLEAADAGTAVGGLTAMSPGAGGWSTVSTSAGLLNVPFALIPVPVDGRAYRLVVREIERIPISQFAARPDALTVELAVRTVFADVVLL